MSNKCATVVVAIVYMLIKFKWNIHKTLEFIHSRKTDVEITKNIINTLQKVEGVFLMDMEQQKGFLRKDWELYSRLTTAFSEAQLDKKDVDRVKDLAKRRKLVKNRTIFYMGEIFLDIEEEASIVNSYLNSQKQKKEAKAVQRPEANKQMKSMQQIIAETLIERDILKQEKAKKLDFSFLDKKKDLAKKKEDEQRQISTFA